MYFIGSKKNHATSHDLFVAGTRLDTIEGEIKTIRITHSKNIIDLIYETFADPNSAQTLNNVSFVDDLFSQD